MRRCVPFFLLLSGLLLAACGDDAPSAPSAPADRPDAAADAAEDAPLEDAASPEDVLDSPDAAVSPEDASAEDAAPDAALEDAALEDAAPDVTSMEDAAPGDDAGSAGVDPSRPGGESGVVVSEVVSRSGRSIPVAVHVPGDAGARAVVVMLPGFQLETRRYLGLVEHLVSHGFVVVRADPPGGLLDVDHTAMAADVSAVLDRVLDPAAPWAARVDSARVGVMGHSLGGKVAAMTTGADLRIGALFGIDPVNGGDPFLGFTPTRPDVLPDAVAGRAIPMGFAGETLNATSSLGPACAPEGMNFEDFHAAATDAAPRWIWYFRGADHMDFVDDVSACFVCGACSPAGSAAPATVLLGLRTLAAAFFRFAFEGDEAMRGYLEGAGLPAGVTERE